VTLSRRAVLAAIGAAAIVPRGFAAPRAGLYDCEGCEAVAEREAAMLPPMVVLAADDEPGKRFVLTGRVTRPDGAPAPGVVVYAHHTDAAGLYSRGSAESIWSRRHGLLRGWAKTDLEGIYGFYTIKPAPYPDGSLPAHIHLFVGEAGHPPYYIDDVVFEGEYGVDDAYRARAENRGGSGIVTLARDGAVWRAVRDIALEPHA